MPKKLFVGIDVSSRSNTVCIINDTGDRIEKSFSIPNNPIGAFELIEKICSVMEKYHFDSLLIGAEATSFYSDHIVEYLASTEQLAKYSPLIYQLNPKFVHGFKKSYPDRNKTDCDDAFVIADRLRFGRLPKPYTPNQPYLPLRRLTRYRCHLAETLSREKIYFLTHLFLKFSSYTAIRPFSNTFGATSTHIIMDFFSPDELAQMSIEELVDFIIKQGKNRFRDPVRIANEVKRVARESYRLRPALADSVNLILATSMETIRALSKCLKEVDKAIVKEFSAFNTTLKSVPGLGPVYSAGIFAEIGDVSRFSKECQIAKSAGLVWRERSSGDFKSEETRMMKSGNKYLRYYLVEAANCLRLHNLEYRNYYLMKYGEVPKHRHKRALVLTARKLVRLVFALLTKTQLYDERRTYKNFKEQN